MGEEYQNKSEKLKSWLQHVVDNEYNNSNIIIGNSKQILPVLLVDEQ